ncbi:hypothetical protein [Kordiimonas marina]|uniref:hypothetical protein n=1 Tax=Kordiimonas marina TaxID=2872312 RepID=UPI001FF4CF9C|nr:hypothetical protein [Kordiimonas marina]MCJ9429599.1 hypothetical protein [Kordiimonas marina]
MSKPVDLTLESPYRLLRPLLQTADKWLQPRLNAEGMLERSAFTPNDIRDFISNASLFDLIIKDGKLVDFYARVLATHVANDLHEMTGQYGRESLPPELFRRWLAIGQYAIDLRKPFCARASVLGRQNKRTENLVIPVIKDGAFTELLVFSEYWYERI